MIAYIDTSAEFTGPEGVNYFYQLQLKPVRGGDRVGVTIKGTVLPLGTGEPIDKATIVVEDRGPIYGKFSGIDGMPVGKELELLLIDWIERGEL